MNLFAVFESALRLLHPLMPFLTEELWHQLPQKSGAQSIALASYPEATTAWTNAKAVQEFGLLQEIVVALRTIRADMKMSDAKKKIAAEFSSQSPEILALVQRNLDGILRLAALSELKISSQRLPQAGGAVRSTSDFDVRVAYTDAADKGTEIPRLRKEIEKLQKAIESKDRQLANATFRSKAPANVIADMEAALNQQKTEMDKMRTRLRALEAGR